MSNTRNNINTLSLNRGFLENSQVDCSDWSNWVSVSNALISAVSHFMKVRLTL
jgi:hypothetical protein